METGTRKFAAIVVVILLVLGGLVGALFLSLPSIGDDDEDGGWSVDDDQWYAVEGDARWSDWDLRLDGSIDVFEGGSLLLEDCRIEVLLERLAFDWAASIYVGPNASLELRRSELVIRAEPELDNAWVCTDDYRGGAVPHIWRVVNLQGARAPVLEFDVELWSEDCRIAVAVQVAPEAELELLGVFGTGKVGWREWSHVEVQLDDYIGATPRVVVFVDSFGKNYIGEVLLLSQPMIKDDDGPLPGDSFMTGDLQEDGWSMGYFEPFADYVRGNYDEYITSLITSKGEVRLIDSRISSPTGIGWINGDYKPHLSTSVEANRTSMEIAASMGDILMWSGSLTILDSEISFVPVRGTECTVEIDGTTFVGNNAMVTLSGCEGSITRSSFTSERGLELKTLRFSDEITWQVAIEGVQSPEDFVIEDCTFSGYGMEEGDGYGLHLTDANIRPLGCAFDDLELAFWYHEGDPGLDWDAVAGSNSFGDNCAYWYIDTRVTRLEFEWRDMPSRTHRDGYWELITYKDGPQVPFDVYIYRFTTFAFIFAPVLLTGPDLGVVQVDNVTFWMDPYRANGRYVSFDPHEEVDTFWFEKDEDPYIETYAFYGLDHDRGYGVGRVHQEASILILNTTFRDPMVDLYRDGEFMGRLDVKVSEPIYGGLYVFVNISHDMAIPPGLHQITLSLTAVIVGTQTRVLVGTLNMTFFRIDEAREDLDTSELISVDRVTILIDPDVEQEGVELKLPLTDRSSYYLDIITWIGSRLVLETIDIPGVIMLYLSSTGPGEVVIGDVTAPFISMVTANTTIVLNGHIEGGITLWTESSDVVLSAQIRGSLFYMVLLSSSNLMMAGSIIDTTEGLGIDVEESNATINDCTFTTIEGSTPVNLMARVNSSIKISDCTFLGTSMFVSTRDTNCTIEVVGCTFKDPGSYLLLLNYSRSGHWDDRYDTPIIPREGEISGNIFDGEGTGLVFHLDSRNGYLGPNIFKDGAKALALLAFQVSFEDQTYGCYTYVINVTEVEGIEVFDLFVEYYWRDWFRLLVDMTDDPLNGDLPDAIPVAVRITNRWSNRKGVIVMFGQVPLDGQSFTIDVQMWDYPETELLMLIPDIDDPGSWWTDT